MTQAGKRDGSEIKALSVLSPSTTTVLVSSVGGFSFIFSGVHSLSLFSFDEEEPALPLVSNCLLLLSTTTKPVSPLVSRLVPPPLLRTKFLSTVLALEEALPNPLELLAYACNNKFVGFVSLFRG